MGRRRRVDRALERIIIIGKKNKSDENGTYNLGIHWDFEAHDYDHGNEQKTQVKAISPLWILSLLPVITCATHVA